MAFIRMDKDSMRLSFRVAWSIVIYRRALYSDLIWSSLPEGDTEKEECYVWKLVVRNPII